MNRSRFWASIAIGLLVVGACEPSAPPIGTPRTAAPASVGASSGASPSAAAPAGSPTVEVSGTTVTIKGRGDKNTSIFALDGNYVFKTSTCPSTGVIPFVWVYEEFGNSRGTFVDAEFLVKNLKGNFYLRIAGSTSCDWTVMLTKA